jgi:maltooligosyltrehalose trehalohydrolase
VIRRWSDAGEALIAANFGDKSTTVPLAAPEGNWRKILDSADDRWRGPGSSVPPRFESSGSVQLSLCPKSFSVFQREAI